MTIAIISNSRADHGPLTSVIAALPEACVITFDSTGMSPAIAMAQALPYFTMAYKNASISRVLLLGDRYETLAAGLAALFLGVPVAHIHGGETTTGAFDDPMRHALTHIADLHFVALESAAHKVNTIKGFQDIAGHNPSIHVVGVPGIDGVAQASATRKDKTILACFHPETKAIDYGMAALTELFMALAEFPDYSIVWSHPNNDPLGDLVTKHINAQIHTSDNWSWYDPPHAEYISAMQRAAVVVGNSSAGIIEAPWIGIPSVNTGDRQKGRPQASSVFQWSPGDERTLMKDTIDAAIAFNGYANPFYTGGPVGERIATILRQGSQV